MVIDLEVLKRDIKFRENINVFLPALFELIPFNNKKKWNDLQKRFLAQYEERYNLYSKNTREPIVIKASLFDYITDAANGSNFDKHFLGFINKVLEEVSDGFTISEKHLLSESIEGLVISFDEKFRNYLGELCVINQIHKNKFSLVAREIPVNIKFPYSKKIDFVITHKVTSETHNVEILNVNIAPHCIDLKGFIFRKIYDKVRDKEKNGISNPYLIIPVFWCNMEQVILINELYKIPFIDLPNIYPPCVFIMESNTTEVYYSFGTISSFFTTEGKFIGIINRNSLLS